MKKILIVLLAISFFIFFSDDGNCKKEKEKWNEYKTRHFLIYYKDAPKDLSRISKSRLRTIMMR